MFVASKPPNLQLVVIENQMDCDNMTLMIQQKWMDPELEARTMGVRSSEAESTDICLPIFLSAPSCSILDTHFAIRARNFPTK